MNTKPRGYNPLRYDCEKSGCFNIKKRPKIEMFKDCFPGSISFGDVDGIVEIAGNGLMLEWKPAANEISRGQSLMHSRLTRSGMLTVLCVVGDAENMTVTHHKWFRYGKEKPKGEWHSSSFERVHEIVENWAKWAKAHPRIA